MRCILTLCCALLAGALVPAPEEQRIAKNSKAAGWGINPYPHIFKPTKETRTLQDQFKDIEVGDSEAAGKGETDHVKIAGRLVLHTSFACFPPYSIRDKCRPNHGFHRYLQRVLEIRSPV